VIAAGTRNHRSPHVAGTTRPPRRLAASFATSLAQCENSYLNEILKQEFGFDGFITSDWGATHSTVASANAGMDMQMPDASFFGTALKQAVQNGQVPMSRLDDMVARILRQQYGFGFFDHPSADTFNACAATPAHLAVARTAAEHGAVLLKNADHILPLGSGTHSIAGIGDGAGQDTMSHGGGSAVVNGTGAVTRLDGIKARAGAGTTVSYAQGNLGSNGYPAVDSSFFAPPSGTGPRRGLHPFGQLGRYRSLKTPTSTLGYDAPDQLPRKINHA
jgi:beta-glucosidase